MELFKRIKKGDISAILILSMFVMFILSGSLYIYEGVKDKTGGSVHWDAVEAFNENTKYSEDSAIYGVNFSYKERFPLDVSDIDRVYYEFGNFEVIVDDNATQDDIDESYAHIQEYYDAAKDRYRIHYTALALFALNVFAYIGHDIYTTRKQKQSIESESDSEE